MDDLRREILRIIEEEAAKSIVAPHLRMANRIVELIEGCTVAHMRDLDGTGSLHACAKEDPGSFPVFSA